MSDVQEIGLGANGRIEIERLLATVALGVVAAVRTGRMTPSAASQFFFVPALLSLGERGLSEPLVDALQAGSELEDVETLAPHGIVEALVAIERWCGAVLESLPPTPAPLASKWLRSVS